MKEMLLRIKKYEAGEFQVLLSNSKWLIYGSYVKTRVDDDESWATNF